MLNQQNIGEMNNLDEYRNFMFEIYCDEEDYPDCVVEFEIQDLLETQLADMTKEEKLNTIDALILDIQDYRKEVSEETDASVKQVD